jgi:enoyl-CoA hydratase/carnithine racemase
MIESQSQNVVLSIEDGIATIRLNDPLHLNPLTFGSYAELERMMLDFQKDPSVDVVILTGEGRGFCSGGSVDEIIAKLLQMPAEDLYRFTRMSCNLVANMQRLTKPIVAAVNGIAAGAGAMLALASDLRLLSDRAKFAFLFVKAGLAGADMGACHLLPQMVGRGKASELLFLGEPIMAEEAFRIGLANRVVPHEKLMEEALSLARKLQDGPLHAIGITKQLLNNEASMSLEAALEMEASAQALCMGTADFREGYDALVEKRKPRFHRKSNRE